MKKLIFLSFLTITSISLIAQIGGWDPEDVEKAEQTKKDFLEKAGDDWEEDEVEELFNRVLSEIQGFEPEGIAGRDIQEYLLIQLSGLGGEEYELERVLIRDYFTLLQKRKYSEIAKELDIPAEEVKHLLDLQDQVACVDGASTQSERLLMDATAEGSLSDPTSVLQDAEVQSCIEELLMQLNEKQRHVVESRFGINGQDAATLEEVGENIGVTRERVRQIQVEALRRLRKILEREGLSADMLFK